MANKQARALSDGDANGVKFRCNDIVEGEAKVIKDLEKSGVVDSAPEAVAYALSEGSQVVLLEVFAEVEPEAAPEQTTQNPLI